MTPPVRFGIDRAAADPSGLAHAAGRARLSRVGMVTNEAARLAGDPGLPSRVALRAAGVPLARLFAPEHGLSARGADGAPMRDGTDAVTGLPIVSLYGERFAPPDESLADLDLVVFDVPDVGARFYTYTWTLSHVLEACARTGTPLVVLDRPNPLGGVLAGAEGPMLDEECCASFVGRWAIPIRHALTLGELATHWARTRVRGATLGVVPCDGWARARTWPSLALPWIPTSPSMPSYESARLYPGLCLFEGTNLSVGRGTATPFQLVAAPWLEPGRVIDAFAPRGDAAVRLHPGEVTPCMPPYEGVACAAIHVEVLDDERLRPVAMALQLMATIIRTHQDPFAWARYPTAANPSGGDHFARLAGVPHIAPALDDVRQTVTPATIAQWTSAGTWATSVREALLYR